MAAVVTTPQLEANYDKFIAELTNSAAKYGVEIQSVGGVLADDPGASSATSATWPTSPAAISCRSSRRLTACRTMRHRPAEAFARHSPASGAITSTYLDPARSSRAPPP